MEYRFEMDIIRFSTENKIEKIGPESKILPDLLENLCTSQFEEAKYELMTKLRLH